jgi:putative N6-adenine-specific DNA methylase
MRAGVENLIHWERREFSKLSTQRKYGCIVCNPPYGERSGELADVEALYSSMGRIFDRLSTWSKYVLTSHAQFEKLYTERADRRRKLYNGRIECTYFQYLGPRPPWERSGDSRSAH